MQLIDLDGLQDYFQFVELYTSVLQILMRLMYGGVSIACVRMMFFLGKLEHY